MERSDTLSHFSNMTDILPRFLSKQLNFSVGKLIDKLSVQAVIDEGDEKGNILTCH